MEKRTFVILGNYRGGTSVVTGVMQQLGLFIGDNLDNDSDMEKYSNYEDLEFQKKPIPEVKEKIKERNKEHDQWGWKDPLTIQRIEEFYDEIRNPHLVCIFRDIWAVVDSMKRHRSPFREEDIFQAAFEVNEKMKKLVLQPQEIVDDNPEVLPVSYETFIRYQNQGVKRVAQFMRVSLDQELLDKATSLIHK